jgi:hypothetical protein
MDAKNLETFIGLARSAGSGYLNYSFGWKPFISDLTAYVGNLFKMTEQYLQFSRDSGRQVRRAMEFDTITKIEKSTVEQSAINFLTYYDPAGRDWFHANGDVSFGPHTRTVNTTQTYKFSGAYTYFLNEPDGFIGTLLYHKQLASKLLGLELSPELLWELAPWSWLFDWKTNIGIAVSNNTRFGQDNLVLKYGYLQRYTIVETTYTQEGTRFYNGYMPGPVSTFYTTRVKERVRATPYGFSLNPSDLTDNQWAILLALGLSKAPGSFRRY